jgi:dipeptidyl aminopeptidase/acylaminoacyl peptidase
MTRVGDLRDFPAIPAVTAIRLAPDGRWLAAVVRTLDPGGKKFLTSIWRIDTGEPAPVRLTRSAAGEAAPDFLADGSLLFTSRRPAAHAAPETGQSVTQEEAGDQAGLWLLPAGGGEARQIAAPPGGVADVSAARDAAAFVYTAAVLPAAADAQEDAARRKARGDAGVNAILHESGDLRYWDHDLGPDSLRLLAGELPAGQDAGPGQPRDLTPDAERALDEQKFELTPDGSAVVTSWRVPTAAGERHVELVVVEVATGARRTLLSSPDADFDSPRVSPDGTLVVAIRSEADTYDRPGDVTLVLTAVSGGDAGPRDLLAGFDRRPAELAWAPDSRSIFFTADDRGRRPVFRVSLAGGDIIQITADGGAGHSSDDNSSDDNGSDDNGSYDNLCPSPDGRCLYALRNAIDAAPEPVRITLTAPGEPAAALERLHSPAPALELPGQLTEVETTAADGTAIRAWLVLPRDASPQAPAPLLLWVHGGPISSWNTWSWRWNPWLMAARGYAVLLPDPALSTGYGQEMIARGHGDWGASPYTDVMAITDAVIERPEIDASRTAMMGGSFGGYLANWIAGHTDRFQAIVSHAGLWALDQMFGTTDWPSYWRRSFGDPVTQPERYAANSPHLHVANIGTPMLVIHGDKDYRVPVGEALRLWADLTGHAKEVKFLYFPDENHWILKPGDAVVWYETIFAFLAQHVLGEPWQRPELL